jgi:hypothetical protein
MADGIRQIEAFLLEVALPERPQSLLDVNAERGQIGNRAKPGLIFGAEARVVMRHVPPDHHDRQPGLEDDLGRIGIHPDAVLGGGDDIAVPESNPAHDHAALDLAGERGMPEKSGCDVGQRAERHESELATEARGRLKNHFDGVALGRRAPMKRQADVSEPILPVAELRRLERAKHRLLDPGVDGDPCSTSLDRVQSVLHTDLERNVPGDDGDRLKRERRGTSAPSRARLRRPKPYRCRCGSDAQDLPSCWLPTAYHRRRSPAGQGAPGRGNIDPGARWAVSSLCEMPCKPPQAAA